jgi:hypothetical protein
MLIRHWTTEGDMMYVLREIDRTWARASARSYTHKNDTILRRRLEVEIFCRPDGAGAALREAQKREAPLISLR